MSTETKSMHITPADGNVFADLGFSTEEAAALKARSNKIIAEKIAIKEQLMQEIADWMHKEKLRQVDAAKILGVTRPRVSDVIRKQTINFTIDALLDMIAATGKKVRLAFH